jgi:mono/diheme cytochrome c family protein
MSTSEAVRARVAGALSMLAGCALLLSACRQQMFQQPSYRPFQPSSSFADGTSARPLPGDTVARGQLRNDQPLFTGKDANGRDATEFPFPITRDVLTRGQQRFDIYCSPCHGFVGDGDGMLVRRGFTTPPTYHSDRLRQAPVGHFFDVITNGFGSMPSYADQVAVPDRWAIVAYIRALQLSQQAPLADVPPDERARLEAQP